MDFLTKVLEHILEPWSSWQNMKYALWRGADQLGNYFTDLGSETAWPYLISSLMVAYVLYFLRDRSRNTARTFLEFVLPGSIYRHPSAILDCKYLVFSTLISFLVYMPVITGICLLAQKISNHTVANLGLQGILDHYPIATSIAIAAQLFLFAEFLGYAGHYLLHRIPLLWAFHSAHHSAEVLTPLTLFRVHPVDELVSAVIRAVGIGVGTGIYTGTSHIDLPLGTLYGVNAIFFIIHLAGHCLRHSHVWFSYGPVVSWILLSPAQHQIHHSNDAKHFNANFGNVLSIWDALFGTLYIPKTRETLSFGLPETYAGKHSTVLQLYCQPFREAASAAHSICVGILARFLIVSGGSGNSDIVISGSLASPNPPGGGEPKERGDEENETQSRNIL